MSKDLTKRQSKEGSRILMVEVLNTQKLPRNFREWVAQNPCKYCHSSSHLWKPGQDFCSEIGRDGELLRIRGPVSLVYAAETGQGDLVSDTLEGECGTNTEAALSPPHRHHGLHTPARACAQALSHRRTHVQMHAHRERENNPMNVSWMGCVAQI